MSFYVWRPGSMAPGICKLAGVIGVPKVFQLIKGVSRSAGWPVDAHCVMDPDFPKDIALQDSLDGACVIVVSERAAKSLAALARKDRVELLPVRILNHKARLEPEKYYIVNPLQLCDCVDEPASGAKRNPIAPDSILACAKLVLKPDAVPEELAIFRLATWPDVVIVRNQVREVVEAAGLTGFKLVEPANYKGLT